ncbi:PaaI family thioesterase [Roseomonas sp. BN140053]|uniref:PaaI family thioesterase n=1 Tax=Roseomonas sp. BN140053 TaxID=3391898 RepID=UPI0039EB818B
MSDADWRSRAEAGFGRQPFLRHLGATATFPEPGHCELRLPWRAELTQERGFFHGGVVGTMADAATACASVSTMPAEAAALTVEYKVNFLRPALGEVLLARARVIKPGRTLTVASCDLFALGEGREVLCATATATVMRLDTAPTGNANLKGGH